MVGVLCKPVELIRTLEVGRVIEMLRDEGTTSLRIMTDMKKTDAWERR